MRLTEFLHGFLSVYDDKLLPTTNEVVVSQVLASAAPLARFRASICVLLCESPFDNIKQSKQQIPAFNDVSVRLPDGRTITITDKGRARMLIARDTFGVESAGWIDTNYLYLYNFDGDRCEVYGYWSDPSEVLNWVGCGEAVTMDDIEVIIPTEQINRAYVTTAKLLRQLQADSTEGELVAFEGQQTRRQ